jgi:hypothetical protein
VAFVFGEVIAAIRKVLFQCITVLVCAEDDCLLWEMTSAYTWIEFAEGLSFATADIRGERLTPIKA